MIKTFKRIFKGTYAAYIYRKLCSEWKFFRRKYRKTPSGFLFSGHPQMEAGCFEKEETKLFSRLFSSADVFLDIGANIGYYSCLACQAGLKVIAIEPVSDNLKYLYGNIKINGWQDQVEVFPLGLSDKPGLVDIFGGGTGASLIEGWAGAPSMMKETIPVTRLDHLLDNRLQGKRLVIKMDVEGVEFQALSGATKLLSFIPMPIWLIEITFDEHRQGIINPNFQDTFELFWKHGYNAYSIGSHPCKISREKLENYLQTGNKECFEANYLFVDSTIDGMQFINALSTQ